MLKKAATSLMLAATILGCANLRIDVDVYKGPLANDEEVQIEQMAAMAIGAKPLLFTLRDRLECEARNQYTQCTDCVGVVPPFTELRREYMKERPNHLIFRSDLARQVNGILYLYSNKSKFDDTPATVKLQLEKLEAENNEFEALARSGNATYQAVQSKADDVYFAVLDTMLALRDPNLLNDPNNPMTQEAIDYAIWQGSRYIEFTLRSGGMQGLHSEEPSRPLGKAIASKLPDYQRENFLTSVNPTQRFPKYAQISDAIAQLIADDTGQALLQALRDDSQYYKDHYYDPESLGEKLQRTGRRPYITLFRAVGVPEDLNEKSGVQSPTEGFVSSQNMAEVKAQELPNSSPATQQGTVEESTIPPHVVKPFMNALA
ncbi:MAG: hypothetical protein HYZ00_06035, partial [Candidatus Hydrogenedentes bacterium]|nr:hypothetical protein [Candidatus Hydrogenedentota bacterium]